MPYAILHPNPEKRSKRTEVLNNEIAQLKAKRDQIKQTTPKQQWYPGRKASGKTKGTKSKISYYCSDGAKVTQEEINKNRSESYKIAYGDKGRQVCKGCEERLAEASAHSIPQARCKQIHKTELIWDLENFWPACHYCNRKAENPKSESWKELKNKDQILNFIEKHDKELFSKFKLQIYDNPQQ
jgi:hypothetical protein